MSASGKLVFTRVAVGTCVVVNSLHLAMHMHVYARSRSCTGVQNLYAE